MIRTVRGRLLLSYVAILLLMLVASLVAAESARQLRAAVTRVVESDDALERVVVQRLTLMDDQETGVRGYLLTHDRRFLQPYQRAVVKLPSQKRRTLDLVAGDRQLMGLARALTAQSEAWQHWARGVLSSRRPTSHVILVSQQLEGKRRFDAYRRAGAALLRQVSVNRSRHLAESDTVANRLTALLLVIFVVALASAALITRIMTRSVTEPLLRLGRSAAAIGDGQLHQPFVVHAPDEFRRLARSMEQMRLRLIADREALQDLNASLERRVQERTRQLHVSNTELESFAYSVSHDLRAPLRSIEGFSGAMMEDFGHDLPAEAQDYLSRVRANAQRMAQLIDSLLQLSRITRSPLERREVDLSAMAQAVLEELQEREPPRVVKTVVQDGVTAQADERLMRPALQNLLENAWKFTAGTTGACIEFGTMQSDPTTYYVRDNGAGFDMKYADKLFGAFQRLHTAAEFEGTGIGLATVQRIIHRHDGEIWAEAATGHGATFYFTLEPSVVPRDATAG